ncbi:exocyst complex component 4, partial [Phenoliferia sp. Uapishka_3]
MSRDFSSRSPSLPGPQRPERSMRRPLGAPGSGTPSPHASYPSDGRFPESQDQFAAPSSRDFQSQNGGRSTPSVNVVSSSGMSRGDSAASVGSMGGNMNGAGGGGLGSGGGDKSRRMMDNLNNGGSTNGLNSSPLLSASTSTLPPFQRPQGGGRRSSVSSNSSTSSSGAIPQPEAQLDLGATPGLASVISAFSSAGQRRDGRRGGLADQGIITTPVPAANLVKKSTVLDPTQYPDTPAFREIEVVLRRIGQDWPVLMTGTSADGDAEREGGSRDFDPVTLALSLLSSEENGGAGGGQTMKSFMRMKGELDHAISSTLNGSGPGGGASYRAYESSITTYNSTLASLTRSQRQVGELKKSLGEVRDRLEGKGKEGLAGMWDRMGHLEEMGKILDEIDYLRAIPDRLETLMSDKRFLTAVVLLVRSLKTINKAEMMEIGALTDLRAWLVSQEGVLQDILIEELHNHLYLKSFYCDARFKAYTRGQTSLPLVDFGDDVENLAAPSHLDATFHTSGRSNARLPRLSKLQRYLNSLSLQPSSNPLLDEPIDDLGTSSVAHPHPSVSSDPEADASSYDGFGSFSLPSLEAAEMGGGKREREKNAEMDSFVYIESLLESLAVLGKLGVGLDTVGQRVGAEIFALVESTVEEVEDRNDSSKPLTTSGRPVSSSLPSLAGITSLSLSHASTQRSSLLRLSASESSELELNVETLRDLFWTLFSKLDAVLQGFRVAYEVAGRIAERRDFKDSSLVKTSSGNILFSLLEVWKPVQQEVRALLHDYLTDDQSGTVTSRNPIVSVNEVLRLAKPRDNSKQIFKFADSDIKASSKTLKPYEDELNRMLKIAVPGLATDALPSSIGGQLVVSAIVTDDRVYGAANSGGRNGPGAGTHKALVSADAFNVSVLFGPTWAFLERAKTILPGGMLDDDAGSGFGDFLNDFVLRTFLPQLEEKVSHVFHQAVGGHEAFQEDPNYKKISSVPIVKSVSNLMLLISSLCSMLRATPFHRQNYSHLIVSVIHQFLQRCQERFTDLASRDLSETTASNINGNRGPAPTPLKTSATWADLPELNYCMVELRNIPENAPAAMREALKRETKIELEKKGNGEISSDDLISPSKKLLALGTLYSSLDWFIVHVSNLKTSPDSLPGGMGVNSFAFDDPSSPSMDSVDYDSSDESSGLPLPLTKEMAQPFEALLKSYRQLADQVLFTLRLEIRLRTIHFLDKATRDGVYQLAEDIAEPDPSVVDLNSDLADCDECAAATLGPVERKFIFEGLSLLMDQLLISNSRYIRLANKFGLSKMQRNILALQQNLKNIGDTPLEVDFERSRKFWDVFGAGPKEMMNLIRTGAIKYDFEDYKALLNLMCGVDQSSKDDPSTAVQNDAPLSATGGDRSRRAYNEYLIDLFALDVEG